MNNIGIIGLGIGAILLLSVTTTTNAFANHEVNTAQEQQTDSNFEQTNRNGDNYIIIEQSSRSEIQENNQQNNYANNNNQKSGKGTFKVNVEWDGHGSLCLREDNHNRDVIECQKHNGGTTLFVIPKGIIPQGSSYEVCGGTHCEIFYNEVVKGPEYVSLNY